MSLTTDTGLTPADIAACTGNCGNNGNGMWGGDGAWLIILFFIFAWGWGGFGGGFGGNGGGGQALTRGELCQDMSFQDVKREIQNANDAVNLGFANLNSTVCAQQYDTAGKINALGTTVQQGFNAQTIATLQGQNALATQIAGCCCDAQQTLAGINYNISTQACDTRSTIQNGIRDVLENQNANARAVLDKLTQQEIAAKDAQITALNQQLFTAQLSASQGAQTAQIEARADARLNRVLNAINPPAVPAYPAPSPCGLGNWAPQVLANSYANGCGCNTGCGCGMAA